MKNQHKQLSVVDESVMAPIQARIKYVRNVQVMLDRDLAELYGVPVKRLNEQVKRNLSRFPADFMFQLSKEDCLRSQIATLNGRRGTHLKYLPYAFTENGIAMLSSVLRSETAIDVNIRIMRAFTAMRRFVSDHAGLVQRVGAIELKQLETDKRIDTVFDALDRGNLLPSGILPAESEFDSTTSTTDFSLLTTSSCAGSARPLNASAVASLPTPPATRRRLRSCWQWCHKRRWRIETQAP